MKATSIIWGICVVLIFAGLTVFGFIYTNQQKEYRELEEQMEATAEKYVDENFLYEDAKEGLTLKYDEMGMKELKTKKDSCIGYVDVKNNGLVYEYNAFIKCDKYTTKGY